MQKLIRHKIVYHLLFLIAFGYFFIDLGLDQTITEPPQGIHQWRQSDGASMARIFGEEGNSIFKPKIFNQFGDDGSAGGEFPLFYFLAGKAYSVFGYNPVILRFILFLPLIIGLLAMLDSLILYFENKLFATISMFLFLCSPTFMNYAVSTLPDAAAFGMALIGSSLLIKYHKSPSNGYLIFSSVAFIIAGLTKISMLLPLFALIGACVFTKALHEKNLKSLFKVLLFLLITLIPIIVWYQYISWYNELHQTPYFATSIRPIWQLDGEAISRIWTRIIEFWLPIIFTKWFAGVTISAVIMVLLLIKSAKKEIVLTNLFLLLGSITYGLLFFINLEDHDYYFIPFFFLILGFIVQALKSLETRLKDDRIKYISILILAIVSWQTSNAAVEKSQSSYQGWFYDLDLSESLYDIEVFLEDNNIPKSSKFVVPQDESSNISLFFLNRAGYTKLSGLYNEEDLDPLIDNGVDYALVLDTSFYSVTFLKYHITDTIGYHHELGIYKVGHSKWWKPEVEGLSE
ncbi:hypothetical protein N9545_06975 [Salibacteraceae bacterium]|nr:hypothetical protein [Salibacteraceae bacterium]MDB4105252.1 hypothetical protein [Salibacteraceae bacterium]MDB9709972.1 hypothetical protein [Salibacteraceae bacterium]MDC1304805.1 hypothetical protein [Salibacteraceae bacterium]